jgi:uncharacterized PurR-regulated membrane protein YhhQ (DUF165 family)
VFNFSEINKSLLIKLVIFHTFIIALSNYLVTIKFDIWDIKLTWAAFTFPLVVVATDLTIRLVNKENARAIVTMAFIPAIIASILVIGAGGAPESVAIRVGIASGCAYLVSSLLDVYVFQKVRERWSAWFWAPALAAVFSNVLDTFTFFSVAFYNSANEYMANNWHVIAFNQTGVKVIVSLLVILPLYGVLLSYMQKKLDRNLTDLTETEKEAV